jgi:SAM-dependent methyltransferase/uncharacterized protein YbaR (Trm112 family)
VDEFPWVSFMKISILDRLTCPSLQDRAICGGALVVEEGPVAPTCGNEGRELHEGLLGCSRCGKRYPLIAGVAILLNDELSWLRANYYYVMEGAARAGGIGRALMRWLDGHDWHLANQLADNYYETPRWVNMFAVAHYRERPAEGQECSFLDSAIGSRRSVFEVLPSMIQRHLTAPVECALDIGTNVGGMAFRVAPFAKEVFGIDVAFNPVLLARQLQCGFPTRLTELRHYLDGHRYVSQRVGEAPSNTEFLVASASQLPLRGKFGLVTAMNVIDVVPQPRAFLKEISDVLADGGLLLLTSPYSWASDSVPIDEWLGGTEELPSAVAVRNAISELGLEILEEVDEVPWVLREHQRWHRVFLNHCVIARKSGSRR